MTGIFSVVLALLGVVALMLGVIYLMKWLGTRINGGRGKGGIRIAACTGVGQDKQIIAVRAGGKNLLIGVTQGSVSLICELSEADMEEIENGSAAKDTGSSVRSFSECLGFDFKKMGAEFFAPRSPDSSDDDTHGGTA